MRGLSLAAASGGHSSSRCAGFSLSRPLLLWSTGSRRAGSAIVAHSLVAPRHVGSSQTRAGTRVPCIGRQILNHCATREAPIFSFLRNLHTVFHCSQPLHCFTFPATMHKGSYSSTSLSMFFEAQNLLIMMKSKFSVLFLFMLLVS